MKLQLVFAAAVLIMTDQISESQASSRLPSDVYSDKYFNSNQKYSRTSYTEEFAHLAARFINFIGIRGTSERTKIELEDGASQFQDQMGTYNPSRNINTHAAHQIKAKITIPVNKDHKFIEIRNRLGHTDILDAVLNERIGTVIDDIQEDILKEKLLQRINFKDGSTDANIRFVEQIQAKFIDGIDAELKRLKDNESARPGGKTVHPDFDPNTYHVLKDLLNVAKDTYKEDELLNEALKAGIINYYNELRIEGGIETTTNDVPPGIPFPNDSNLSSKALLGRRQANRVIVNVDKF